MIKTFSDLYNNRALKCRHLFIGIFLTCFLCEANAQVKLAIEEENFQAISGGRVAMGVRDTVDQSFEPKSAKIVRHLGGCVRTTKEGGHARAQVAVPETMREMHKGGQSLEEGHDARISKAESGNTLAGLVGWALQPVQCLLGQHTVVADMLDFQKLPVGLLSEVT